jgi:hypothetical protein
LKVKASSAVRLARRKLDGIVHRQRRHPVDTLAVDPERLATAASTVTWHPAG